MISRSRFSHDLNTYFEKDLMDTAIANDIANEKPIFKNKGGRWNDLNIDAYLGFFEAMEDYLDAGSLNKRDVYDNYSDDILKAYNNVEIKKYIQDLRTESKDSAYYEKFEKLAKDFTDPQK